MTGKIWVIEKKFGEYWYPMIRSTYPIRAEAREAKRDIKEGRGYKTRAKYRVRKYVATK